MTAWPRSLSLEESNTGCHWRHAFGGMRCQSLAPFFSPTKIDSFSLSSLSLLPSSSRRWAPCGQMLITRRWILHLLGFCYISRGKQDAKGTRGFLPKLKRVCKAVKISAHQSLHLNQEILSFGSYWGKKPIISFKVYLIRQRETDFFDNFTALIRLR